MVEGEIKIAQQQVQEENRAHSEIENYLKKHIEVIMEGMHA